MLNLKEIGIGLLIALSSQVTYAQPDIDSSVINLGETQTLLDSNSFAGFDPCPPCGGRIGLKVALLLTITALLATTFAVAFGSASPTAVWSATQESLCLRWPLWAQNC